MRAAVNPSDGQLYMVGLLGWGTTATANGGFERLRYAGGNVHLPEALHITPQGIKITFASPVDPASAQNVHNYDVERWEYIYSKHYGSPRMSLANPEQKGQDTMQVASVEVSQDRRTIFLKIPDMQSVMQMKITYDLKFEDGKQAKNTIYTTVNWLSKAPVDQKPQWQQRIIAGVREPFKKEEKFSRGQRLISNHDCKSCHAMKVKNFGPSFMDIARRYPQNKQVIDSLSSHIIHGVSGNWGKRTMPPHPQLIKSDAETIVRYILSLPKNDSTMNQ
jgi:cytochrome c551/c552